MEFERKIIKRLNRIENIVMDINQKFEGLHEFERPITVDEAAQILKKSENWVRQQIKEKRISAIRNGRRYMLSLFEIRRLTGIPTFEKK